MGKREFTLSDLFEMAMKWMWMLLIGIVVFGALAFYYSKFCVTPMYSSTSKYFVQTKQSATAQENLLDSQRSVAYAQMVVSGYIEVLDTYYFADDLSSYLDGNLKASDSAVKAEALKAAGKVSRHYSGAELKRMITYSSKEESVVFSAQVVSTSAADAHIIAKYIEIIIPDYISQKASDVGVVSVIDGALLSKGAINNRTLVNTLLGVIVGAIIAFVIAFIVDINDTRVKDEKELADIFALPVIGAIPDCSTNSSEASDYVSHVNKSK